MSPRSPDNRFEVVDLRVTGADGQPLAYEPITVEQESHAFGFGNIGFDFLGLLGGGAGEAGDPAAPVSGGADLGVARSILPSWLELFNTVTLPFYWRGYEPSPGVTDRQRLKATAQYFVDHGVTVKGHPLVWHTLAPQWLMPLDPDEVERVVRERITREVTDFAGLIDLWDAINEAVILPVFTAEENAITRLADVRGRVAMVRLAFETARAANPRARLVLNDFDLSPAYEALIEECLAAGIPIDAIGLQTHMHQGFRGEEYLSEKIERFARFGLPLQMTETTLVSGDIMPPHIEDLNDYVVDSWPSTDEGEARQAEEIVRHYRTVLAHTAVESLTYWGLTDAGAWLGAPSGLLRADGSPKPSFEALHRLIRGEWWHPARSLRTDADGNVRVRGFAGRYSARTSSGAGTFEVPRGGGPVQVVLSGPPV
ncbi:endo-1,4-beta-xylanase [Microbacterium sp. AZCO]|uniref:endo-1,4-beta-xylanase n=1 Tax=Microbacterium sp. AZCO TaxID=3142976 RepID=UPI0031F3E760